MQGETGGFLGGVQWDYIVLLLIYSGIGPWLVERFTRNRSHFRAERRQAVRENLELLQQLARLRGEVTSNVRRENLDAMWTRLMDETASRIEELNRIAEEEGANPGRNFLILPTPRTAFGVVVSLVFALAVYVSLGALVVLGGVLFTDAAYDPVKNTADLQWTLKTVGFSAAMMALAFLARFVAFRLYNSRTLRMRASTAERPD